MDSKNLPQRRLPSPQGEPGWTKAFIPLERDERERMEGLLEDPKARKPVPPPYSS